MKYFNKFLSAAFLCLTMSFSANAVLIKQNIHVDNVQWGFVTVEVDDADINTGLLPVFDFVELNIFGETEWDVFDFEAVLDTDNLAGGIEALFFDVTEIFGFGWSYQVAFDVFNPAANFIDVFDAFDDPVYFSNDVSVVSEPSIIVLFGLAFAFMAYRRKRA